MLTRAFIFEAHWHLFTVRNWLHHWLHLARHLHSGMLAFFPSALPIDFACAVWQGNLRVKGQAFGEITAEKGNVFKTGQFSGTRCELTVISSSQSLTSATCLCLSGILGLGYPSLSAYDIEPVFDNVMDQVNQCTRLLCSSLLDCAQSLLAMNTFSFYFSRCASLCCCSAVC